MPFLPIRRAQRPERSQVPMRLRSPVTAATARPRFEMQAGLRSARYAATGPSLPGMWRSESLPPEGTGNAGAHGGTTAAEANDVRVGAACAAYAS